MVISVIYDHTMLSNQTNEVLEGIKRRDRAAITGLITRKTYIDLDAFAANTTYDDVFFFMLVVEFKDVTRCFELADGAPLSRDRSEWESYLTRSGYDTMARCTRDVHTPVCNHIGARNLEALKMLVVNRFDDKQLRDTRCYTQGHIVCFEVEWFIQTFEGKTALVLQELGMLPYVVRVLGPDTVDWVRSLARTALANTP